MPIPEFQPQKPLKATYLNQITQAVNRGLPVYGSNGVLASHLNAGGTAVSLSDPDKMYFTPIIGKIVLAGPAAEADFTDYRYWVHLQKNVNLSTTNELIDTLDVQDRTTTDIVAGFNLSEYTAGTHDLPVDTLVTILPCRFDEGSQAAPRTRYLIVTGGSLAQGMYQWQGYVMVSNNQTGWEFDRTHPLL